MRTIMSKGQDLTGKQFGEWTVVGEGERDSNRARRWNCLCRCTKTKLVYQILLLNGKSKSCGCLGTKIRTLDLTGKKFGKLTVVEQCESKKGRVYWKCRCDCDENKFVEIASMMLMNGKTKSCGCLRKELASKRNLIDLTGKKFGRLLVLRRAENGNCGQTKWWCRCECSDDKEFEVHGGCLATGNTQSCGCLMRELARDTHTTHGMCGTPEYKTWAAILKRCYSENDPGHKNYGGRGITVCDRWRNSFENFFADMGERRDGFSIERIDTNGNYCPENCCWADKKTQANNKRTTVLVTFNGETLPITEWASKIGIKPTTLYKRVFIYGWPIEEAMTAKKFGRRNIQREMTTEHRLRRKAVHAVQVALRHKKITRPETCQYPDGCQEKDVQAHHHKGYSSEHRLDVIWLCRKHHEDADSTRLIEFNGVSKPIGRWAEELGITTPGLSARLENKNWTFEEAMTTPKKCERPSKN